MTQQQCSHPEQASLGSQTGQVFCSFHFWPFSSLKLLTAASVKQRQQEKKIQQPRQIRLDTWGIIPGTVSIHSNLKGKEKLVSFLLLIQFQLKKDVIKSVKLIVSGCTNQSILSTENTFVTV